MQAVDLFDYGRGELIEIVHIARDDIVTGVEQPFQFLEFAKGLEDDAGGG